MRPQGELLHFRLLPSSSDTLGLRVPKFGTGVDLDTRNPIQDIFDPLNLGGHNFENNKITILNPPAIKMRRRILRRRRKNVSTQNALITMAQAAGRTHALERQDGTAEVGTGACNCVVCGRAGRKCPAHRRMRCARAAQSIVAGAGGSGWHSRG